MKISMGMGLSGAGRARPAPTAPDYEEPIEDDIPPPEGEPEDQTETPIDPETDEPEPGIDPDFTEPDRIEVIEDNQGVTRTEVDPNTWAVAYVAAEVSGPEYCEIEIHPSTPRNATMAVGFTTLAMPLNGIPGELAGTIAWWSNGDVRQNGVTIGTLAPWGRGDRLGLALDELKRFLKGLNCGTISSALGDLSAAGTLYPFVALYSTGSRARFRFSLSTFGCPIPEGFYPIGQVPPPDFDTAYLTSVKAGAVMDDGIDYTDSHQITSVKAGAVLNEGIDYTDSHQLTSVKVGAVLRET